MTDVAKYERPTTQLVMPATGEVIPLDAPTNDLARARDEIRDLEGVLRSMKALLDRELVDRFDKENAKSVKAGGYEVKVDPPMVWATDGRALRKALFDLAAMGVLSTEAVNDALPTELVVKPARVKLKALHEHPDPRVREACAEYDRRVPNPNRRVSVKVA